jgi:signal transduction histidine kinase/DNA-binding NarL/FixJ family response regulator/HPt (histidine-containing phosphotransfer) domain-containing protein
VELLLNRSRGLLGQSLRAHLLNIIVALAYFAAALASYQLTGYDIYVPAVWIASAILVTALVRTSPGSWPALLVLAAAADFGASIIMGGKVLLSIGIAGCDLFESLLIAVAIRRARGENDWFLSTRMVTWIPLACIAVSATSAACAAGLLHFVEGAPFAQTWRDWFSSGVLGLLTVGPFLWAWTEPAFLGARMPDRLLKAGVLAALVAAVSWVTFSFEHPVMLVLPLPFVMLATFAAGFLGTTTAIVALTTVAVWHTLLGGGPLGMHASDVLDRIHSAQFYAASMLLSALPVAFVLAQREFLDAKLRRALAAAHEARRIAEEASERAEVSERAKGDFVAAMSHEIRTPLTGLLGLVDLVAAEQLSAKVANYLAAMRTSGRHLIHVVNDILDFSRIESGKIELEHIDFSVAEVIERVQSLAAPQAAENGLDLTFEIRPDVVPAVKGDPTRIQQILLNLVSNGLKFTHRGGVSVRVSSATKADGQNILRFDVRDSGIGIPEEQRSRLFDAFTQADRSTTRRYGGSGLGLAISKRLVTAMHGEIGMESIPGVGSHFWFEIPVEIGQISAVTRPLSLEHAPVRPLRILLAEDVELNRDIVRDMLSRHGHEIVFAKDGREAVDRAMQEQFDVVLMDVQMPVMDGVEATRRIRALEGPARHLPILGLSANVLASEQSRYLAAGMNECLSKPINWTQLFAALARHSGDSRSAPNPVDATSTPELALIDRNVIDSIGADMPADRLSTFLQRGIQEAEQSCERIRAMRPDSEDFGREVHRLKGTSGTIGFMRISSVSEQIQAGSHSGKKVAELVTMLQTTVRDTKRELLSAGLITTAPA